MLRYKTHREEFLALPLLFLFVLVFSYEMIFASKIPLFRDLGPYFYPMRFSLAQSFKAGELPLWEPQMAMGFPLLANFQSGVFYPPNFAYGFLPFFLAVKFTFLLHYFVAAVGAYFLLRHWKFSQSLALTGSVLFAFGGCMVSLSNLLNHFQTAVWLPWLLLSGERQLTSSRWSQIIPLILVATVQFLAGSPEIYTMSMVLLILDGLRIKWEGRISYPRVFLSFLWVNLAVAGIAMVQILPTLELLLESGRTKAVSLQGSSQWSLHPLSLVNLLLLDKEVDISSYQGFQSFFYESTPLLMSLYMGSVFPFGLWMWWITESKKRRAFILGGTLFSLLFSLGYHTPLYGIFFHYFPFMILSRYPGKFFFLTFSFLIYVTLQGLSTLLHRNKLETFKILSGPAILLGIFIVLYLFFRIHRNALLQLIALSKEIPPDLSLTWDISSSVLFHLERQIVLSFSLMALFWIRKEGRVRQSLVQVMILLITFVDLFSAHKFYQFLTDQRIMQNKPKVLEFLGSSPPQRIFFSSSESPLHPISAHFPNAKSPTEHMAFAFETLRPNMGIAWGVNYMQDIDALGKESSDLFRRAAKKFSAEELYRLLGILNVKYLISLQELPRGGISLIRHFPEHPSWVYRIEWVVPRAYIVAETIYEKDPMKTIERLAKRDFDPLKEVVVDEPVSGSTGRSLKGEVKIDVHKNRTVRLHTSSNGPGILVLSDSFYPGWEVYIDGVKGKIIRANYFFRGIHLPKGNHQVVFSYNPASFRHGLAVTLLSLIMLLGFLVRTGVARRVAKVRPELRN